MTLHVAVVNRHPADAVGGSELQCDLFARGLVDRGHTVTYIALDADARADAAVPAAPAPADLPYTLVRLDRATSARPGAIVAAVRDAGADVAYWRYGRRHLDTVTAGLAAAPAVPVVLAVAHVDDVSRWPSGPPDLRGSRPLAADLRRRLTHRRSWRAFDHLAAVAAQREDFVGRAPVVLQEHVPNVVDPTVIPFAWPRPYVAWVANLKARKRPEQLAPLAGALAGAGVDLLIAGALQDPRYRPLTVPDATRPNLHPLGRLAPAEAAGLIAGARCLAVTARPEGLSNAMIQAWWHGVPTVSLDYDPDGAIAALGLGAVCGGDPAAFRRAVLAHADGGDAGRAAGDRARTHAHARFALDTNVALLERLLAAVVSGRPSEPPRGPASAGSAGPT